MSPVRQLNVVFFFNKVRAAAVSWLESGVLLHPAAVTLLWFQRRWAGPLPWLCILTNANIYIIH